MSNLVSDYENYYCHGNRYALSATEYGVDIFIVKNNQTCYLTTITNLDIVDDTTGWTKADWVKAGKRAIARGTL